MHLWARQDDGNDWFLGIQMNAPACMPAFTLAKAQTSIVGNKIYWPTYG
jgi:hypothetical protein